MTRTEREITKTKALVMAEIKENFFELLEKAAQKKGFSIKEMNLLDKILGGFRPSDKVLSIRYKTKLLSGRALLKLDKDGKVNFSFFGNRDG